MQMKIIVLTKCMVATADEIDAQQLKDITLLYTRHRYWCA